MVGKGWKSLLCIWAIILGVVWMLFQGCSHYEPYPKGKPSYKESKIQHVTPSDIRWEKVNIHYKYDGRDK